MPRLGADIEQIEELAAALRDGARRVDDARSGLESRRRAVTWTGPDARRFAQEWHGVHAPALQAMGERWRGAATTLDTQCAEQRRASAAAPATATSAGPAAEPLAAPHAPRREVQVLAGSAVTAAGSRISIDHEVTASWDDDDDTVRLEVAERRAAGVRGSIGAETRVAAAGAPLALGASAGASVELGQIVRRTYAVEDGALWPTIARVEAELAAGRAWEGVRAVPAVGLAADLAPAVVHVWDRALDLLPGPDVDLAGVVDGIAIAPEPDRVETLTEVALQVGASASLAALLGVAAGGELTGMVRVGESVPGRGVGHSAGAGRHPTTRVIELEGELAAVVQGSWLDRLGVAPYEPGATRAELRIELPEDGAGGSGPASLTWERHHGAAAERGSVLIDPDGAGAEVTEQLRRAAAEAAAGRPDAAWHLLRDLDPGEAAGPTTVAHFDVVDRTAGGSSGIGLGATVELAGDGGVRTLTRRP